MEAKDSWKAGSLIPGKLSRGYLIALCTVYSAAQLSDPKPLDVGIYTTRPHGNLICRHGYFVLRAIEID